MKRILFIGIGFYEYDKKIFEKLSKNNKVDYFSEAINYNYSQKIMRKFFKKNLFELDKIRKLENKILKNIQKNDYDEIIVIKSDNLSSNFYKKIKAINKNIILKLYLWDDIQRMKNFNNIKGYFDKIYTFDLKDSQDYKLEFLPLFYVDDFSKDIPKEKKTDIYFSGWNHSDRIEILKRILKYFKIHKKNLHIYVGIREYVLNLILKRNALSPYFSMEKITMQKNIENTKNAKMLIDIHHPTQNGLTMRTIEALGARCKLITTNKNVLNYDFYNSNNILIIDRENLEIDVDFIDKPYVDLSQEIYEKYSLTNWVKKVLEE